jgi:hypothetical protein
MINERSLVLKYVKLFAAFGPYCNKHYMGKGDLR